MCGIFGYIGKKNNAGEIILNGLKTLEYRGYDSWGVGVKKVDNKTFIEKNTGKIGDATLPDLESNIGIGHTRWATHGGVTKENAHPHSTPNNKVIVVHNGIVENYLEIKKFLEKQNILFKSETDTEVIAHLIGHELQARENNAFEAIRNAFLKLEGRNAIVVFLPEHNKIFVVKNGSPVVIGIGKDEYFLSSDASALLPHTREVIFLEDGNMIELSYNDLKMYKVSDGQDKLFETQILNWDVQSAEKGNYDHFLMKEIMEQDQTILNASAQRPELIQDMVNLIKSAYGTYFVASGTAAHACRTASYIFSIIAKRHVNFCIGSEFAYQEKFLTEKSLLIAASQSGETADTLDAISAAKKHGSKVAALVNAIGSSISREANITVPLNAGPEIAVLSTKAFTAKLVIMFLLAYGIENDYEQGKKQLELTAEAANRFLYNEQIKGQIERIAEKICSSNDIYLLGRGISYPLALEGAHKIKEASYIHAEGFAGGEPKHCEISLVSNGTPAIIFVPNDETKSAILSNAIEYKARGAYIIGIGPENHNVFDEHIQTPDVGITSTLINVLPVQILAYYLALKRGTDPDKPRNLAKSVTVK